MNLTSLIEKNVSVDRYDVTLVENSRVNVVKVIPLPIGGVLARRRVVAALQVRTVMVADRVEVVDVVV